MRKARWGSLSGIAVLSCILLSACGMDRLTKPANTNIPGHAACVSCHRTAEPSANKVSPPFAGGIEPSSACLDCHHYDENHHPVNTPLEAGSEAASRSGLPLFDGQIRCLTCHQAHVDPGRNELNGSPKLLRGGPYPDQRALCFRCHGEDDHTKVDPHKMLSADGSIRSVNGGPVCLLCHTEEPDPADDPDLVEFKADVAFLCWRCHAPMKGSFLKDHFHARPKKATRVRLRSTEGRLGIEMPLARDGMITCSTCHNPHQTGVITRAAVRTGADSPRKLRIAADAICEACHAK